MADRTIYAYDGVADLYGEIGERIRALRTTAGMTQGELGVKLGFGTTYISQVETATTRIDICVIYAIAEMFDVHPHDLLP